MIAGQDRAAPATNRAQKGQLWQFARGRGMSRRRFLRLLTAGGTAAVLAACTGVQLPVAAPPAAEHMVERATASLDERGSAEAPLHFKDPTPFIDHGGGNLEARLQDTQGLITPNRFFFVRNNSVSLDVDAADWRLTVEGDAIANPLELFYDDIRNLPSRTLISYLECGGNHRAMFDLVKGRPAQGTQWMTGAVSNGDWTGVSLRDVLTLAGITKETVSVLLIGLDADSPEEGFRRVMPVAKAMDADTLLAYALNGESLPKDHGFPVRALAPGWVGSASIKWLGRIVVSSEQLWTRNNTTSYTLIGDDYPPEGEALGKVVRTQTIKSALALPWPAELAAGGYRIHGYAHSPTGPIAKVEWSLDSGKTWSGAAITTPQVQPGLKQRSDSAFRYSWARFGFAWEAQPGEYSIMTRATDAAGNTQPDEIPFNEKGYLFNQPVPHPIRVT